MALNTTESGPITSAPPTVRVPLVARPKAPAAPRADKAPDAACLVTITGPVKGHPPVTIACYGSNPKVAINALKKLLVYGRLEVTT